MLKESERVTIERFCPSIPCNSRKLQWSMIYVNVITGYRIPPYERLFCPRCHYEEPLDGGPKNAARHP